MIVHVSEYAIFPILFLYPSLPDFDSASIPATVVIATDSSMECFSVQITNDLIPEGDESFTLSLTTPPGVLTGLSTTIITILGW